MHIRLSVDKLTSAAVQIRISPLKYSLEVKTSQDDAGFVVKLIAMRHLCQHWDMYSNKDRYMGQKLIAICRLRRLWNSQGNRARNIDTDSLQREIEMSSPSSERQYMGEDKRKHWLAFKTSLQGEATGLRN